MQKARGQSDAGSEDPASNLPLLVSIRFQVLFHSPPGDLFTFPSQYLFTIGCPVMLSLRRWSSRIPTGFPVSRSTWVLGPGSLCPFAYKAITLFGQPFQVVRLELRFVTPRHDLHTYQTEPHNPGCTTHAGFNVQTGLG